MKMGRRNIKSKGGSLLTFGLIIILIVSLGLLSGCNSEKPQEDQTSQGQQVPEEQQETVNAAENFVLENLTLLQQALLDIDGDEQAEKIELYTSAQRGTDGKIMWDDGQRWVLLARDSDKEYPLFDGYIQLGNLQFWVYTGGEKNTYEICTVQPGSASFIVTKYNYVKEKQYFTKEVIYNPENVNMLYSAALQ